MNRGLMGEMDVSSDSSSTFAAPDYGTNIWLEITNVSGGQVSALLHNGTDQVYAIWSTTNLLTGWSVETEVWPTDANSMPFTVLSQNRQNLFLRAEDWTGVTENGNTTPDWWLWEYFGATALCDTNLDSKGNTLLYDYQNGLDPNVINFSIQVTNQFVSTSFPPVQLDVSGGLPFSIAVLVDSTNFAGTNWSAYTSPNITVNLGSTEGWHDVWIGLRGRMATSQQTWQWLRLKLDTTSPLLVITNPVSATVSQPMIQIQGFSLESLRSISYDITNAAGLQTNQQVLVLDQYYDTNTWEFTTNTFQAFDVDVTNGLNTITFYATDLAGNVTTTNFSFTPDCSSKTNPPVVQITWPQNGAEVCGTNFTLDGQLDDPTAIVSASITDTNGNNKVVGGLVERTGRFWVENLPLSSGTNYLAITVTDAAGNVSVTNLAVVQSTLILTINAVPDDQLWQLTVNVGGTISDPDYAVWVNGRQGTNNGNGTWSASNVPVASGGVASFTVVADAPGQPQPSIKADPDKPCGIYVESDQQGVRFHEHWRYEPEIGNDWEDDVDYFERSQFWTNGIGGSGDFRSGATNQDAYGTNITRCEMRPVWPPSFWPSLPYGTQTVSGDCGPDADQIAPPPTIGQEHCDVKDPVNRSWEWWERGTQRWWSTSDEETYERHADTTMKLYTGGKAVPKRQSVIEIGASAAEILGKRATPPWGYNPCLQMRAIPPQNVTIGDLKKQGSDGILYVALPDGIAKDVTPKVDGVAFCTFNFGQPVKHVPVILANGIDLSTTTPEFCVGQRVTFQTTWTENPPPGINGVLWDWTVSAKFVNRITPPVGDGSATYDIDPDSFKRGAPGVWYVSGGTKNAKLDLTLSFDNGQSVTTSIRGKFNIFRPAVPPDDFRFIGGRGFTNYGIYLGYGNPNTGVPQGMLWNTLVNSAYDGRVGLTQILKIRDVAYMSSIWDLVKCDTLDTLAADSAEFYYYPTKLYHVAANFEHQLSFEDWPYTPLGILGAEMLITSAEDYIRFKPGLEEDDGNIYVTLAVVHWNAHGDYDLVLGWVTNSTPDPSPPGESDEFPKYFQILR